VLYNPKWENPAEIFSLKGLINWLERQDPAQKYKFHDCAGRCLISQYLTTQGLTGNWKTNYERFPYHLCMSIAAQSPYTFGAALERARSELPWRARWADRISRLLAARSQSSPSGFRLVLRSFKACGSALD
jgi:hypothetical protein